MRIDFRRQIMLGAGAAMALIAGAAGAQPADLPIQPATTSEYPQGVKVGKVQDGQVYTDARGRTLYGLDMRILIRFGADAAMYCKEDRCQGWEPLLAPADAKPNIAFPRYYGGDNAARLQPGMVLPSKAPDWSIIQGPSGPQYVFKGWHLVYVRKDDKRGSTAFEGAEAFRWNTLKFVPPVPQVSAPPGIAPVWHEGSWVLSGNGGRLLFGGKCGKDCSGWTPLAAGSVSRSVGEWAVSRDGDQPQWLFRGAPVFIAATDDPANLPAAAVVLRP